MSVIDTLITDRTAADVAYVTNVNARGVAGMSADELTAYLAGLKGAYSYIDLNRVGQAVSYLLTTFSSAGYVLTVPNTPKTDWTVTDAQPAAPMAAYLANVAAVRAWLVANDPTATLPTLPASMRFLTYDGANAIEAVLVAARDYIDRIEAIEAGMEVQAGIVWNDFII